MSETATLIAAAVVAIGIVVALIAAQPQKSYMNDLARQREDSAAFTKRCRNDPAWLAKETFSKDTATWRRDNAYATTYGSRHPVDTAA